MASDVDLLSYLESLVAQKIPYCTSDRFGPTCMDCSGAIHNGCQHTGVDDGGAAGWTSKTYEDWTTAAKLKIPVAQAKQTPAALLYHGHTAGPLGHIAIVRDANTVFESPCKGGQYFGVSPNDYNDFDSAGLIPGLLYSGHLATLQASTVGSSGGLGDLAGCLSTSLALMGIAGISLYAALAHIL
jgi:hypothetical protein